MYLISFIKDIDILLRINANRMKCTKVIKKSQFN